MPVETPHHEDIRFEPSDLNTKATFITGVCVVVGMFVSVGLLFFYFTALKSYRASVSQPPLAYEAHGDVLPPEPRLQQSPHDDLKRYTARQNWEETHYHWLDKGHGVVAIPIERAIQIVAQRGIPPATGAPNATNTAPKDGTRETGFAGEVEPEPR